MGRYRYVTDEEIRQIAELKAQRDELVSALRIAAGKLHTASRCTDDEELSDEWARAEHHIKELIAKVKP